MPRPVGEPGPRGADLEARRKHQKPGRGAEHTPAAARTPRGAAQYAHEHTVATVTPSGHVVPGPAATPRAIHQITHSPYREAQRQLHRSNAFLNASEAEHYRSEALQHIARKNFKIVEGAVQTKTEHVPVIKTSPAAINFAHHKLATGLAKLEASGAKPREVALARQLGSAQIAKENYRITRKGKVAMRKVKVPVLKTSPQQVNHELRHMNRTEREIRHGRKQHPIILHPGTEHRTWLTDAAGAVVKVGKDVGHGFDAATTIVVPQGGTTGGAVKVHAGREAVKATGKAVSKAAQETGKLLNTIRRGTQQQQALEDANYRAAGLGFIPELRQAATKGARTGVLLGGEYLTRGGMAVEQQIARELSGSQVGGANPGVLSFIGKHVLTPQARKEFAKANPLEALLHGHKAKHLITGGDIGEQVFGLRQLGLPIDIGTDPLMYIGFAGLPAKFAERTAAITARLEAAAPDVLKSPEFANILRTAQESGDYQAVTKWLETKAGERGISLRRLGKTDAEKAAIRKLQSDINNRDKELFGIVKAEGERAEKIGKTKINLGGQSDKVAAELLAREMFRKQLRPGFTLELRTPLGRKLGGIGIPVPRKLAEARIIPQTSRVFSFTGVATEKSKMLEHLRALGAQNDVYKEIAKDYEKRLNDLSSMEYGTKAYREAERQFNEYDGKVRGMLLDARLSALNVGGHHASLQEMIDRYNSKRFQHEIARFTRGTGRAKQQIAMHYVERALKPVLRDDKARARVNMYMHLRHDTGATDLLKSVAPLSKKEAQAVTDLEKVYNELERYGREVGTLPHGGIEDYVPRYMFPNDELFAGLHDMPKSEETLPMGGRQGAHSAFQHHRGLFEMSSIADRTKLAHAIEEISTKPITREDALRIADKWHELGRVQLALEDLAQAVQRGEVIHVGDLTELQKKAVKWAERMKSQRQPVPNLFQNIESTDGILKLSPEAYRAHNLVEIPFNGLSTDAEQQARIASILEGRQRLLEAAEHAQADNPALAEEYRQIAAQRSSELARAKEAYKQPLENAGIRVREVGQPVDVPPGNIFADRQPFIHSPENNEILLGQRGATHGTEPAMRELSEGATNRVQGEIIHDEQTPILHYGTQGEPPPAEVREALRQHTGLDLRSYDEWKAAEQQMVPQEATAPPTQTWRKPSKGESVYVSNDGLKIAKQKDGTWAAQTPEGPATFKTLKEAKEELKPPPPPDVEAMHAEANAIEGELPKQHEALEQLRGEVGSRQWVLALKNPDGSVSRYLKTQYASPEDAEKALTATLDAGHLPKGQYLDVVEDPTTSAAARREAAETYAAKATHVESMENELTNLQRQIAEVKTPPSPEQAAATAKTIRTTPPPPAADGAAAPTAEQVGMASDAEIANAVPNASEDFIGTLHDFRNDHPDMFPVLDPLLSNFQRTRAEGLQTIFRLRWSTLDKAVGRSEAEAAAGRWAAVDGREGFTHELKAVYDAEGKTDTPIAYLLRDTGDEIAAHDIQFHGERTLIPTRERDIWFDPNTGREYIRAERLNENVSGAMREIVGPDRLWPTDVISNARAEFMRYGETGVRDLYDAGYEAGLNRLLALSRYGVTSLFPAYHFRNMMSDVIQSMMGDPGVLFHPIANTKLAYQVMRRGGKARVLLSGDLTGQSIEFSLGRVKVPGWGYVNSEDYLATMDAFGLRSNQHLAELANLAERGNIEARAAHWWGRVAQSAKRGFGIGPTGAVGRRAIEFGARREDIMRAITFTQRMRRNGGDFADAMWWTIKHHFDYGDLTLVERRKWRNLFLFYTWYRKNIPLQFTTMIRRPGFFSALTNTYVDLAQGETPLNFNWSKINPILPNMEGPMPHSGLVPDYMFNQLAAFSTNWNHHALAVGFGAPYADLNLITRLTEAPEEALRVDLGLLNPAITWPFQFAFKKDFLTGREFKLEETSGAASMVEWIANKFGVNLLKKDEYGNPVLPWAMNLAFNYVPVAGRFSGYLRPTPVTEDQGRLNKLFGGSGLGTFLTGINVYTSPESGERLDLAYISRVIAWGQQRKALAESMTGLPKKEVDEKLHKFDEQIRERAKLTGVPFKFLQVVNAGWPFYVTQQEREGFKLSPGNIGEGSSLGGLESSHENPLGGSLELEKHRNFKSEGEEALEKYQHPGMFEEFHIKEGGVVPFGLGKANEPSYTGAEAKASELTHAERLLHLNQKARERATTEAEKTHPKVGGNLGKGPHVVPQPTQMSAAKAQQQLPQQPQITGHVTHKPNAAERALAASILPPEVTKAVKMKHAQAAANTKLAAMLGGYGINAAKAAAIAEASRKYNVGAPLLAAIGKIESGHGTSTLPGVHSGQNSAGAAGPFQIGNGTGAAGDWWHEHMPANADIYNYHDAVMGAAKYLHEAGATQDPSTWHSAALSYNHSEAYANEAVALAQQAQSGLWNKAGGVAGKEQFMKIAGHGRFTFPFPSNRWEWSRTDMGTDFAYREEGAPIRALASGTIRAPVPGEAHWEGGNGLLLELDKQGHLPSKYIFLYEGINPTVKPGQHVKSGQVIATGGITGSIETGFANSEGVPLAADIYHEGDETPQGQVMTNLLHYVEKGKRKVPVRLLQVGGTLTQGGETGPGGGTMAPGEITPGYHPGRSENQNRLLRRIMEGKAVVGGSTSSGGSLGGGVSGNPLLTSSEAYGLGATATKRPGQAIVEETQRATEGRPREVISQRAKKPKFGLKSSRM